MAVTIHCNGTSNSLVHKGNGGFTKCTLPDVCKTPSPGGPVPVPYPVIVSTPSDLVKGSTTVKIDGGNMVAIKGSEFSRCTGDEPGTAGGVMSSTNMKEATWILYSFDVKIEGKNACRLSDKMLMNHGNTACLAGHFAKPVNLSPADSKLWDECEKQHDKYKALQAEEAGMADETKNPRYAELERRVGGGTGSHDERVEFADMVEKRLEVTKKVHKERKKYIDMDCDKFNWKRDNSTPASRKARHEKALKDNVGTQLSNLHQLLQKVKPF